MDEPEPNLIARVRETRLAVAIDGPAGAGKTTIGVRLARLLNIPLLDTGMMYRAVTRVLLQVKGNQADAAAVVEIARTISFSLEGSGDQTRLSAGGHALTETELHRPEIDLKVPLVAANPKVRMYLVEAQRTLARDSAIVMLGRDIGTVVLPDAPVKLFVTADAEARAQRRRHDRPGEARLLESMRERDRIDASREASPLRQADDAILLDTTNQSVGESVTIAIAAIETALS